jgi:hypothetical protein
MTLIRRMKEMSQAMIQQDFRQNASARQARNWKQQLLALAGVVLTLASTPGQAAPAIRNIVLVYGAFADGSSCQSSAGCSGWVITLRR